MDVPCIFLGIKVKPGPIERVKLENFTLDNTVGTLKAEAEKKSNVPSASLELIHHGKILKENTTLQDNGVKYGEMVHVVKKKEQTAPDPRPTYTDAELQQLNTALRSLGCTPNAAGWTRAMQLLNDESIMQEITERAPSLGEDCVALSILHEVELLAALGANIQTMRRGAEAHPELPAALMQLTRLERARATTAGPTPNENNGPATSGFVYSLEALSEEEDAEEEETEETEHNPITQEQLAAALQAATEAVSTASNASGSSRQQSFLQLLRGAVGETSRNLQATSSAGADRAVITPEMFSEAISEAISRAGTAAATPMEQGTEASSGRADLTPEAINEALSLALNRAGSAVGTSMDQSTQAGSERVNITREMINEALTVATNRAGFTADVSVERMAQDLTPEAINEALTLAMNRAGSAVGSSMEQSAQASSARADFTPEAINEALTLAMNRVGSAAGTFVQQSNQDFTPEAINEALTLAMNRVGSAAAITMEPSTQASSSQSPVRREEEFTTQLTHMHEMGLLDDAVNVRALLICAGDVNAAINLVFSGAIGDD